MMHLVIMWVIIMTGLEDTHHVYEEKGLVYNAVLGLVDVVRGTNSYYKLQLLEGDAVKNYCVFRAWGRVGTAVGNNKLEVGASVDMVTFIFYLYVIKS